MTSTEIINELEDVKEFAERYLGRAAEYINVRINDAIFALERQKCENCKILELLVDMEIPTICEDDYNDCEYCEQNCNFKAPTKECYLHWAEHKRKESRNDNT